MIGLLALAAGPVGAQAAAQSATPLALDARLSPDGLLVVARALDAGSARLMVVSPYDSTAARIWLTAPGSDVGAVAWTPDNSAVVYRLEENGHLYLVPADGGAAPRDLTPQASAPARLAGFAPDGSALVEMAQVEGAFPDLYGIPLDGAAPAVVQPNVPGVVRWTVDGGIVRLAVRELEEGDREILRPREGALVPVFACTGGAACEPIGFHPDGRVWLRSAANANALLLLDPLSLQTEVVRPDLGVDTRAVFREDSTYARAVEGLAMLLPGLEIEFLEEPQGGGGRMLIAGRDAAGATIYVFDRWMSTVTPVLPLAESGGLSAALLPNAPLAWPEQLTYRISDGDPSVPATEVRRRIRRDTEDGRPVLIVLDEAEVPVFEPIELDTTLFRDPTFDPAAAFALQGMEMEDASDEVVLDASTLRPISRQASGPLEMELDFGANSVSGVMEIDGFATRIGATASELSTLVWTDGAALELLVAALPLAEGYATPLTYFDTGAQTLVTADLVVRGAARADTEAGSFDAWALTLTPRGGAAGQQTWLVRRGAPHLLLRSTLRTRDLARIFEIVDGITEGGAP